MIMQWDAVAADDAERVLAFGEDELFDWLDANGERTSFEVDKAWHAVHFTLTGEAWEVVGVLGQAVLGGEDFGEDLGYGCPRWLAPAAVAEVAAALAALPPAEFEQRLDFAAIQQADIYPSIWDRDPEPEQLVQYVRSGYETIRDGFAAAAAAGQGFVITLL